MIGARGKTFLLKKPVVYSNDAEIRADSGVYEEWDRRAILWQNLSLDGKYYRITADSMIYVETPELLIFSGNVKIQDTAYTITSKQVIKTGDSAVATGELAVINNRTGLQFYGDSGVYYPSRREGRVWLKAKAMVRHDSTSTVVEAKLIKFRQDTFRAYGDVISKTGETTSRSDSALFIRSDSTAYLWGDVSISWEKGKAAADSAFVKFVGGRIELLNLFGKASFEASDSTGKLNLSALRITILREAGDEFTVTADSNCVGTYLSADTTKTEVEK